MLENSTIRIENKRISQNHFFLVTSLCLSVDEVTCWNEIQQDEHFYRD